MLWSEGAEPTQDSSGDGNGGLFRWTMDALFGSRVSPSRKYKEFSQDDTNHHRSGRPHRRKNLSSEKTRSNSLSGLDPMFYNRYDLLPDLSDDEDSVLASADFNSSIAPAYLSKRNTKDPTDTFAARRKPYSRLLDDDFSIVAKSPLPDDPIISRLFEKKEFKSVRQPELPGKFPSPIKPTERVSGVDYTDEYLQILSQLDKNAKVLSNMSNDIQTKQNQAAAEEETYRVKYRQTRSELISELKHSKALYDNYYRLYGKYQQLKILSRDAVQLQAQVSTLETQLVDSAIEKEKEIHSLTRRIAGLQLKVEQTESSREKQAVRYEARIHELEEQLRSQRHPLVSGVSSLSFSPSGSNYRDETSISNYNAVVDSQFLKNLT